MGPTDRPDFSGWATKAGLRCSDGRTIMPNAFQHQDGELVPLVWQHGHTDPENVLGHAILENRHDGVYAYAFFNNTPKAKHARELVAHKDIKALSIWANKLVEKGGNVLHGAIRELSLVLSGANPGALIENITIAHSDGETILDDEALIYTGLPLEHADSSPFNREKEDDMTLTHADGDEKTVKDVYDSMTPEQQEVLHFLVGEAIEGGSSDSDGDDGDDPAEHGDLDDDTTINDVYESMSPAQQDVLHFLVGEAISGNDDNSSNGLTHTEGSLMHHNVFESGAKSEKLTLSHDDMKSIVADATKNGSFKDAVESYALSHGIEDIDLLFPDFKSLDGTPQWLQRRVEWVQKIMDKVTKSPFARIKTMTADITADEARAKGYTKTKLKKEEFFSVSRRTTGPTTVYKKQKLERDDMIDITDFDVVAWLKGEMRVMLDEELARAILIGDGRDISHDDKIDEQCIRPIAKDHELFTTKVNVTVSNANTAVQNFIDAVVLNRRFYRGTGMPLLFTTEEWVARFLLLKDSLGRRIYKSVEEIALELRVSEIVTVEVMEGDPSIIAIMVNPVDYVVGANRGGEITMFDDFDIDYNNHKYLIETRISGALQKLKSAVIFNRATEVVSEVTPETPTLDELTGVVTIPDQTGVVYEDGDGLDLTPGPQTPIDISEELVVNAFPENDTYVFPGEAITTWTFTGVTDLDA